MYQYQNEPPVVRAKWKTPTIKSYLKEVRKRGAFKGKPFVIWGRMKWMPALNMSSRNWRRWAGKKEGEGGFSAIQPQYVFRLPLKGRTSDEIFSGFHTRLASQRAKSEKQGVGITEGGLEREVAEFYDILKVGAAGRAGTSFHSEAAFLFWRHVQGAEKEDPNGIRLYLANLVGGDYVTVYSSLHVRFYKQCSVPSSVQEAELVMKMGKRCPTMQFSGE